MPGYKDLADDLRRRIDAGEWQPGQTIPKIPELMEEYGAAKQTVRDAVGVLADIGLVVALRRPGTIVRHRTPVRIPLSRYRQVSSQGSTKGPWESATSAQGLDGFMKLIAVDRVQADASLAELLQVPEGADLVHRLRHALIRPDDVVQIQDAWYPADLAEQAGVDSTDKIAGGVFGAIASSGRSATTADETVRSRMPTEQEASQLRIGGKISVLTVERVTRDEAGNPIEVLRAVAPSDRLELVYEQLPLKLGSE